MFLRCKPFLIVASIHGTEYFVLVIFDGINLSTGSTKPV